MPFKPKKDNEKYVFVFVPLKNTQTEEFQGKIHLAKPDSCEVFCGSKQTLFEINQVGIDWVNQADPRNELCQRCKKSAGKYLSIKPPE